MNNKSRFLCFVSSFQEEKTKHTRYIVCDLVNSFSYYRLNLVWTLYFSFRFPAWCIVKIGQLIGASFEIQGLENINRMAGAVVVLNHQSAIDLIGELSLG